MALDELELEILEINQEIGECRKRGDFLSLKSLLLARRDLRLARRKDLQEAVDVRSRVEAFKSDKEAYRCLLDELVELSDTTTRQKVTFNA